MKNSISQDSGLPSVGQIIGADDSFNGIDRLRLAFISDLHLLSSRCCYDDHAIAIRRAIEDCDVCIWGGDLFDFSWSTFGNGAESRDAAINWLESWRLEFPDKSFIYLNGNHDSQADFQMRLRQWELEVNRSLGPSGNKGVFDPPTGISLLQIGRGSVHASWDAIRIGDALFVHGDVIVGTSALASYRSRWSHDRPAPVATGVRSANRVYDAAVAGRLHLAAASLAHRRRNVCLRLLRWVRSQPEGLGHGLRRIVFGHTHRRLNDFHVGGMRFFNGGAAVRHVPFSPVRLDVAVKDVFQNRK